jgi:hypothetical protein
VRERAEANCTREAGHLDEIQGVVANTLRLSRNGAVGFIRLVRRIASLKQLGQNVFLRFFAIAFFPNDLQTYVLRVRNFIDYCTNIVI